MLYIEIHLPNQLFISPPFDRRPTAFCPREEIAEPAKLYKLVQTASQWSSIDIADGEFQRAWIPWKKSWNLQSGSFKTSGLYVVSKDTEIFSSMKALLDSSMTRSGVRKWLEKWHATPFLVTGPVFHYREHSDMYSIAYAMGNTFPVQRTLLNLIGVDCTLQMIISHSYTIANGLTLLLAMYRMGAIPYPMIHHAISHLKDSFATDWYITHVPEDWEMLYYSHVTPQIADHPWYYVLHGHVDNKAALYDLLHEDSAMNDPDEDGIVYQTVGLSMQKSAFTSSANAVLHGFDPTLWNRYILESCWPCTPVHMEEGDTFDPDVATLFRAVVSTRGSWKWWQKHAAPVLQYISASYTSVFCALEDMLNTCSYLYQFAKESGSKPCYSRIRRLWKQVIQYLDADHKHINSYLHKNILRVFLLDNLASHHHTENTNISPTLSFAFLKDIFDICSEKLDIYTERRLVVYSKHIDFIAAILQELGGNLDRSSISSHVLYYYRNTIQMFQSIRPTHIYHHFYRRYMYKRIVTKLLAIQKGFGVKEDQQATVLVSKEVSNMYLVGSILLDYMQDHKKLLIQ